MLTSLAHQSSAGPWIGQITPQHPDLGFFGYRMLLGSTTIGVPLSLLQSNFHPRLLMILSSVDSFVLLLFLSVARACLRSVSLVSRESILLVGCGYLRGHASG